MPRLHFHCADDVHEADAEGTELPDEAAARLEAARLAGEVPRLDPSKVWSNGQWRVEVNDRDNVLLFTTIIIIAVEARKPKQLTTQCGSGSGC